MADDAGPEITVSYDWSKFQEKKNAYSLDVKVKLAKRAIELEKLWNAEKASNPLIPDKRRQGTLRRRDPKWGFINRTIDENIPKLRGKPAKVRWFILLNIS